jgi:hypothetical protein
VGSSVGLDLLHSGVLDADFLAEKASLPSEPLDVCLEAESGIEAVSGPTEGPG